MGIKIKEGYSHRKIVEREGTGRRTWKVQLLLPYNKIFLILDIQNGKPN